MKKFILYLSCFVFPLFLTAQHPLEGTWEMMSISGLNADGEPFSLDTTSIRETKIITSTHYILIAGDKDANGWTFNRCYAGTVKMDGSKYYETPALSSLRIFENVSTDFSWKIDGDRFIQSGTITRPDGKKIILHEFIFQRSKQKPSGIPAAQQGVWKLTESNGGNGLLVITPTHWIGILKNGETLLNASGGLTSIEKGKTLLKVSYHADETPAADVPVRVEGKKLIFRDFRLEKN